MKKIKVDKDTYLLIGICLHIFALFGFYIMIKQVFIIKDYNIFNIVLPLLVYPYVLINWYKEYFK